MRKSIFAQTFTVILCAMLAIQLLAFIIVTCFAEDIYNESKFKQAGSTAKLIGECVDGLDDEDNDMLGSDYFALNQDEIQTKLDELRFKTGARITIVDENNDIVYGEFWKNGNFTKNSMGFHMSIPREVLQLNGNENIIFEFKNAEGKVVEYLYGQRFENGMLAVIGMPVETIAETVEVIKRILGFTIFIAAIVSVVSAFILSKSITRPLVGINRVAREISQLNFSVKYEEKRQDEIGEVGENLNELSYRLEANICKLQKELEKEKTLESLRKQFIAQASHEMQTPLAIIKSYAEAIEDGVAEDETEREQFLAIIRTEADRMSKMVKEMLDISQIEAGAFRISKQRFCFTEMIEEVAMKYSGLAEQQGILFEFHHLEDDDYHIIGDRFRLEQVLTNFISNALKHTPKEKKIILECDRKDGKIKVCVSNQGSQINENDIPYLWETFYKAKTLSEEKGTGLGLAISKHILALHNASYGVENMDDGVRFWFEIENI